MKIKHPSGTAYDLSSGTALQFKKNNTFFQDKGEMSLPVTLPPTPLNNRLLGYPARIDRTYRPQELNVVIDTGITQLRARQIVHGADDNGISTTFYLNDGSLFAKIGETKLSDVFEKEVLSFSSPGAAVQYLETVAAGYSNSIVDERMALFSVRVDGFTENTFRLLNEPHDGSKVLKARDALKLTVDGKTLHLPCGYGVTPFVRCKWALKKVAEYFGYTLAKSFLDASPYKDMVILNNNNDSVLDGNIHFKNLLPDITVKEFLNVFRSRFCCEFYPNEVNNDLEIILFNDVMSGKSTDLSDCLASHLTLEYPEFSQIQLVSERIVDTGSANDSLEELFAKGPIRIPVEAAYPNKGVVPGINIPFFYYPPSGRIYQAAVQGHTEYVVERGDLNSSYLNNTALPAKQISINGKLPALNSALKIGNSYYDYDATMYVGQSRSVKSKIVYSDNTEPNNESTDLPVMLAFYNTKLKGYIVDNAEPGVLTGHSLLPNGPKGLYAQFWGKLDRLYRNALVKVKCSLRLDDGMIFGIQPFRKIRLHNTDYLLSSLTYKIGSDSLCECELLSISDLDPVVENNMPAFGSAGSYKWVIKITDTVPGYNVSELTFYQYTVPIDTIYFAPPTESDYNAYPSGGASMYAERSYSAQWYRSIGGPSSGYINGTRKVGFQVAKV